MRRIRLIVLLLLPVCCIYIRWQWRWHNRRVDMKLRIIEIHCCSSSASFLSLIISKEKWKQKQHTHSNTCNRFALENTSRTRLISCWNASVYLQANQVKLNCYDMALIFFIIHFLCFSFAHSVCHRAHLLDCNLYFSSMHKIYTYILCTYLRMSRFNKRIYSLVLFILEIVVIDSRCKLNYTCIVREIES